MPVAVRSPPPTSSGFYSEADGQSENELALLRT